MRHYLKGDLLSHFIGEREIRSVIYTLIYQFFRLTLIGNLSCKETAGKSKLKDSRLTSALREVKKIYFSNARFISEGIGGQPGKKAPLSLSETVQFPNIMQRESFISFLVTPFPKAICTLFFPS